ncbi:hypothetical protein QWZ08_13680 [Ferruginibacter paludis]|uniref:hypothetical protein n=1 Tax=Ferruginibacter paludis TaxID=1310417 RepID=UPI0025B58A9B|nr:hypothetical protein [Ferruginibacter paludis]MDN3656690.1 hypothetical protein [Ferruginibacter paludis]
MKPFYDLTEEENNQLLLLPVYISLQALNNGNSHGDNALEEAVRFAHIKTFSCDPLLIPYYREVDHHFADAIERLNRELPENTAARSAAIDKELEVIDRIVCKLNQQYVGVIHRSMQSFGDHVAKAQHSVLSNFVLPMPMPGLDI